MTRLDRGTLSLWWWFGAPWQQTRTPRTPPPTVVTLTTGQRLRFWPAVVGSPDTTLILVPGLHMDGPADTRMDRVARIFAAAGMHVVAPHIDAFENLWIRDDRDRFTARAATLEASDWARVTLPPRRQVVFSVSFGSAAALSLMAEREIAHGVLFGGLADLGHTLRFALDGERNPGRDPLNGPAIYRNLARQWLAQAEAERFEQACLAFCQRTWSRSTRPALKASRRFAHVLHDVASGLGGEARTLLFEAVGFLPGAVARVGAALEALDRTEGPLAWANPHGIAARVPNPVDVVHGRNDDVIPADSAAMLAAMLPAGTAALTGQWGHTGAALHESRRSPGFTDEVSESLAILKALARLRGA